MCEVREREDERERNMKFNERGGRWEMRIFFGLFGLFPMWGPLFFDF